MTQWIIREDVDYNLAERTGIYIGAYAYDHDSDYPEDEQIPILEFVTKGGIPVDDMINWCKAGGYEPDDYAELEAYKASHPETQKQLSAA